jgi:hypothetical protein
VYAEERAGLKATNASITPFSVELLTRGERERTEK